MNLSGYSFGRRFLADIVRAVLVDLLVLIKFIITSAKTFPYELLGRSTAQGMRDCVIGHDVSSTVY